MYRSFYSIFCIYIITCDFISMQSTGLRSFIQREISTSAENLEETNEVVTATPISALCMPELQVVKIGPPNDPSQFFVPSCTRIERCGGCCTQDNLLSCQPEEKKIVNLRVTLISPSRTSSTRPLKETVLVPIEKHTKCKCKCIIKPEHCNILQEYVKRDCSCVCTNKDERAKCKDDERMKHWDPHNCKCLCKEMKECQTGYIFDNNTCSCEAQRIRIRYTGSNNEGAFITYSKLVPNQ